MFTIEAEYLECVTTDVRCDKGVINMFTIEREYLECITTDVRHD